MGVNSQNNVLFGFCRFVFGVPSMLDTQVRIVSFLWKSNGFFVGVASAPLTYVAQFLAGQSQ